jgi:hypothetical protein
MRQRIILAGSGLFLGLVFALPGCQPPEDKGTRPAKDQAGEKADPGEKVADARGKHDSWWCAEHGMPEEECSQCSDKVAKECKAKGDWCEKHDRAKSQCFICDPSLKEKYAAKYRARYGKEPPPIEEEKDEKDAKKDGDKKEAEKGGEKKGKE